MSFSKRHGHKPEPAAIHVRDDAPEELRHALLTLAELVGISINRVRNLLCQILLKQPDKNNWSAPNVSNECLGLIEVCPWYKVYDFAEMLNKQYKKNQLIDSENVFEERLNDFFVENGYAWKMVDGNIEFRGGQEFETATILVEQSLEVSGKSVALAEIREALGDLSRRPKPDLTGAIHHSMNALECVARDIDNSNDTLGKIIDRLSLPKPLDEALTKLWGFASQRGRHINESQLPSYEEAELVVTVSSAVANFLLRRINSEKTI